MAKFGFARQCLWTQILLNSNPEEIIRIPTQPPESPYTRRNVVFFLGAGTQVCANFGAIGAIAPKNAQI